MLIFNLETPRRSLYRVVWTITILLILTVWTSLASAQVSNGTLTYGADSNGNDQVTVTVDNNSGTGSDFFPYLWYQLFDSTAKCIVDNYDSDIADPTSNSDEYTGRDQTYSRVIKGNEGKYICVGGFVPDTSSFHFRAFGPISYAPLFSSATVEGKYLVINFDRPLNTAMTPPASVFTVNGVSGVTVSSYTLSSTSAVLTLSKTISSSNTITVNYLNLSAASYLAGVDGVAVRNFASKAVTNKASDTFSVTGGKYYLKNKQKALVEISPVQTVPAFQGATKNSIYTKVTFSKSVKHVAGSGSSVRPNITYTIDGSEKQYQIVAGNATLASGQCQPYSGSPIPFKEYMCRYTVKTGSKGDDGVFDFDVGSATEDQHGNTLGSKYSHASNVYVDAKTPTVNSSESGYYTTYNKDTGVVSGEFNSCSALSSGTDIYMKYVFSEPIHYRSDETESSVRTPTLAVQAGSNLTLFVNKRKGFDIQSGQCAPATGYPTTAVICRYTALSASDPITMRTTPDVTDVHTNYMSGTSGWAHRNALSSSGAATLSWSISHLVLAQNAQMRTMTLPKAQCDSSGDGTYTYSLAPKGSGSLPTGLTFDSTATARTLSGTPTATQVATTYTYTVSGNNATDSQDFDITVIRPPVVNVMPRSLQLAEGSDGILQVSLMSQPPVNSPVYVNLSTDNGKIAVKPKSMSFNSNNWNEPQPVTVETIPDDDDVSDDAQVIMQPSLYSPPPVPPVVQNSPPPVPGMESSITPVRVIETENKYAKAWLTHFGITVADQLQSAVKSRLQSSSTPGIEVTVAGQPVNFSNNSTSPVQIEWNGNSVMPGQSDDPIINIQSMKLDEALSQSTFAMTGKPDSANGSFGMWGQVTKSSFEDSVNMTDVDGNVTTGMLGADYSVGDSVVGAVVSRSTAKGGYDNDENKLKASLNAATLYWSKMSSERFNLWGLAGFGEGSLSLMQKNVKNIDSDISWRMMALGMRGTLREQSEKGGPKLDLVSEAILARTSAERVAGLMAATTGSAKRLRVGLESSWTVKQKDGGSLITTLEGALRHDSGEVSSGLGIQLGAGVAWQSPKSGLSFDMSGHSLIAHEEGSKVSGQGFSMGLNFDRTPNSGHGPSFSVRHDLGAVIKADDAFQTTNQLSSIDTEPAEPRWSLESAWGFPALGGHYTGSPYTEFGFSESRRDYTIGWRLTPETPAAKNFTFEVFTTRREGDDFTPEQSIWIAARARW